MTDSINLYICFLFLVCLFIGGFLAWLLYGKTAQLDKTLRVILFSVRTLVIAVIGSMLFAPLISTVSYKPEKAIIVVAQDNSLSVGNITPAGFNKGRYEQEMQVLADRLAERYEVKLYNFSDSVKNGFDFSNQGKVTNAALLINKLKDEYLNRNVGAVIIASDGIFNRGGSPLYELNKLKAPVFTIALGDTLPKKDLLIANINHNNLVYLDNEFEAEVQVQAFEAKGQDCLLTVETLGKKIYEKRLLIKTDAFVENIRVKLKATKLGLQSFTIQLSALEEEVSKKNNLQRIFVDVIDAKQKVLIAAAAPHPDITALKQAILSNKNFEVKVGLAEDLNALKPNDYGLVILYQLPSTLYDATPFIKRLRETNVAVWYLLGAQTNIPAFNQSQNQVAYNVSSNTLQQTFSSVNKSFTLFDMDQAMVKQIEAFDPLQVPFGKLNLKANSATALNQRIGKIDTDHPQLFFMLNNSRKTAFLMGEGLWRWKLSEAAGAQEEPYVFNNLVSKVIQYLVVKDDRRKFQVYGVRTTFEENENVILNAVLYNDSYIPVNSPDVNVIIKNDAGTYYKFLFSRSYAAYQLDAGMLPPGNYTYTATAVLGDKKHLAKGVFYVKPIFAEYQQTVANHQLLNTMSVQTGGKLYMPRNLLEVVDAIKANDQIKTLSYEDRSYQELINFKWLFALILILLSTEWFFRKRYGEI